MESDGISQVIILSFLIIASAYFSATETAFDSFNKIRIKNLASSGNKKANLVLKLDDDFDNLMSTIIIGNNIVNVAATSLAAFIFIKRYGNVGIIISSVIMMFIILIFAEILPKNVARKSPDNYAMFSSPLISFFTIIFKPLNLFLAQFKNIINKLYKSDSQPNVKEEDLMTMIDEVENEGFINKSESDLIRSAIEF